MTFQKRSAHASLLLAALVSSLALVACDKRDDQTAGQKLDSAIAKSERKADQAQVATENAADRAEQKIENATNKMTAKAEDIAITAKVNAALAGDPQLSAIKIDVDTVDGRVNLSGFAPDAASRDRATDLTKAVNGVLSVDNKLAVR